MMLNSCILDIVSCILFTSSYISLCICRIIREAPSLRLDCLLFVEKFVGFKALYLVLFLLLAHLVALTFNCFVLFLMVPSLLLLRCLKLESERRSNHSEEGLEDEIECYYEKDLE